MSTFTILAIILGVLAGFVNIGFALLNREVPSVVGVRILAALISFATPVVVLVVHAQGQSLVPAGWHNTVYLTLALAIFVGVTLMVPATIQRSLAPATVEPPRPVTNKLNGDPGVRMANQPDEWVN